jgi:hypothetical protein
MMHGTTNIKHKKSLTYNHDKFSCTNLHRKERKKEKVAWWQRTRAGTLPSRARAFYLLSNALFEYPCQGEVVQVRT